MEHGFTRDTDTFIQKESHQITTEAYLNKLQLLTFSGQTPYSTNHEFNYESFVPTIAQRSRAKRKNPITGKKTRPAIGFFSPICRASGSEKKIQNERGREGQDFGCGQGQMGKDQRPKVVSKICAENQTQNESCGESQAFSQNEGDLGQEKSHEIIAIRFRN